MQQALTRKSRYNIRFGESDPDKRGRRTQGRWGVDGFGGWLVVGLSITSPRSLPVARPSSPSFPSTTISWARRSTALPTDVNAARFGIPSSSTGTALSPAFTTLAERFQDAGYETAGFYAGPYLHEVFGLGQGFDIYRYCVEDPSAFSAEEVKSWGLNPVAQQRSHEGITNPGVYRAGRDWMKANKGRPFFAFLHFWDVHYDFTPPAPWDTRFNPGYQGPVASWERWSR